MDAVKVGKRNSSSDFAIIRETYQMAEKIRRGMLALGYENEKETEGSAVSMTSFGSTAEKVKMPAQKSFVAAKAMDYQSVIEMVESAIEDALLEMSVIAEEEDDESLGKDAVMVRHIADLYNAQIERLDYDEEEEHEHGDEYRVLVYPEFAVLMLEEHNFRVDYTIDRGVVVLADPSDWKMVEADWSDIDDAMTIEEAIEEELVETKAAHKKKKKPAFLEEIIEEESAEEDDEDDEEMKAEEFGGIERDELEDSDFVMPKERKFPVMTRGDVEDAVSSWGRYKGPMKFPEFKRRLTRLANRKGLESALPNTWKIELEVEKKSAEDLDFSGIKIMGDGMIIAQAVRFGSISEHDVSAFRDFFTKSTDFWLDRWETRPMLYHHALDTDTADAPVIGEWSKAWVDDSGVWMKGQLDKAHKYYKAIMELAKRGLLKVSTDSAPHLVRRIEVGGGVHEVKRWPIAAASLTVTPAEPRLNPVELKSLLASLGL